MPIFEYKCPSCGEAFERLVRGPSDEVLNREQECPSCGTVAERVPSSFGFRLYGEIGDGGWSSRGRA